MSKTTETVLCLIVAAAIAFLVIPILVDMPTAEERAERAVNAQKPYWTVKSAPLDEDSSNWGLAPKRWQIADDKIYWLEQR